MIKRIFSGIFTLAVIGFIVYNNVPTYHKWDEGVFEVGPDEFNYYEIESTSTSPVRIELEDQSGTKSFDAYLLTETEFAKLEAWMETDDIQQPDVNYMNRWESVTEVAQEDISIGAGLFYVVVDNSILGTDYEQGKELAVNYAFYEKY